MNPVKSPQRPQITQSQRLRLNAGLAASLRVLTLDASGLARYLAEQAAQNPQLRLVPADVPPGDWTPRWSALFAPLAQGGGAGHDPTPEIAAPAPSLAAHVMGAIDRMFRGPRERRIALGLALALEPTGWLGRPLDEVADEAAASVAETEAVLRRLQEIEPAGLFARSLAECLSLQARDAGLLDTPMAMVLAHLDLLARGETARLARLAGVDEATIALCIRRIRSFDPKPGARFDAGGAPVREPDLLARRGPAGWEVALNRGALPALQVVVPPRGTPRPPDLRDRLADARRLRRLVEARGETLLRIAREILARQSAALETGRADLQPLTQTEVAAAVGLHVSTISRAVAGTSIDTPRGTWWLRDLFSARLGPGPEGVSGAAVQARLARLVAAEDPRAPLSDRALAEALARPGVALPARRTVAKYRQALGIPPASARRRR